MSSPVAIPLGDKNVPQGRSFLPVRCAYCTRLVSSSTESGWYKCFGCASCVRDQLTKCASSSLSSARMPTGVVGEGVSEDGEGVDGEAA